MPKNASGFRKELHFELPIKMCTCLSGVPGCDVSVCTPQIVSPYPPDVAPPLHDRSPLPLYAMFCIPVLQKSHKMHLEVEVKHEPLIYHRMKRNRMKHSQVKRNEFQYFDLDLFHISVNMK